MATVSNPIILKITNAGKLNALSPNSGKVELSVNLTHVEIGSGRYTATGNETGIKTLISKIDTVSGDIDAASNTLHFSATIYANTPTPVYELGLLDSTGDLFAIAASLNTPLFTLYPNVAFVVAFGISLNEANSGSVTVTISPNNSLMPAIMQNHLAAPNPHPQYLNNDHLDVSKDPHPQYVTLSRFQLLLDTMLPVGYLHHTHDTVNPKPQFDALLGISTAWRRLAGKIIVGTDPADPYIKDVGLTLGQKGMTSDAGINRPHVYPLYTTNVFERYNPDDFIETVWLVNADKTAVNEGEGVRFTVSANNLPDGQILQWTAKEGALNEASNDITAPVKTASGTVILKNGTATIDFVTMPDNYQIDPQMHVRLTMGLPANLSINVPVNDSGRSEKVVHISSSTTNGVVLDEYYKQHSGAYPTASDNIRFIVASGVDIIAPDTDTAAIEAGINWPIGSQATVENHGRIFGRGGDAGRSARTVEDNYTPLAIDTYASRVHPLIPAIAGGDGGTATKGSMTIENYGFIAGGGGGGGGSSAFLVDKSYVLPAYSGTDYDYRFMFYSVVEAGVGGGAPFGEATYNYTGVKAFNKRHNFDISDYYPALGVNDVVLTAKVDANLWRGAPQYPNPDPIVKENGVYAVRFDWRDSTVKTPSGGHVTSYDHIDHVVTVPWSNVSNETAYRNNFLDVINLPLPNMNGDDYSLFNGIAGYGNRLENVNIAEMQRQGEFMMSYEAKDGALLTGGRGGANVWDSPFDAPMYGDNYQLSASKKWRFTRAIIRKPSNSTELRQFYGSGTSDTGIHFYDDAYTTALDFYNDVKGGDGGNVGEAGQAGSTIPEYMVITTPASNSYADMRIAQVDTNELKLFRTPAAQGGLAGFVKEGAVVISNFAGGSTKGR